MRPNSQPNQDHAAEQREADERARFLQDCAQDGVLQAGPRRPFVAVHLAHASAEFAAARQRALNSMFHGEWPSSASGHD